MRRKLIEGVYVGTILDCQAVSPDWAVVHACKSPCYCSKIPVPDKKSPNYLSFKDGNHLYLNMIDPKEPLFQRRMFEEFLTFAKTKWEEKKKILIHCNQGRSRAPSLALLFFSKSIFRITNRSYDDAWLEFEKLIGEPYTPSEGIEQWLRENWATIDAAARIPSSQPAPEPPPFFQVDNLPTDPESNIALVKSLPLLHFKGFTQIEDKQHQWINPDPNSLQYDINEAYSWCIENKIPCRLMVLKPRQVGCSTVCGHLCYHHLRRFQSDMVMMADVSKRTEKIWEIFNQMSQHDSFEPFWGSRYEYNTIRGSMSYPDGSKGQVEHDTALDPKAGVSGTRQVVWMSEAARFMKTGNRDKKVVTAMMNSLANVPNSLAIAESTAEGAFGWFYENWQGCVTLEERKKGIVGNGWIKVFAAWHEFAEHRLPKTIDNLDYFKAELDHRERRGKTLYNWKMSQIAWRRMKIAKDCGGDVRMYDQDFPEDAEGCFLSSGRPRFDMEKVVQMEKQARISHPLAKMGVLDRSETGQVGFTEQNDGGAWLWVDEKPQPGLEYIMFLDPCQGEQSEGSPFPDAHAVGVLRKGYFVGNEWHKPKLVAAIDVPTGCRWENYLVADRAKMMSDWYGECMIVPETGNGLGIIEALRRVNAYVYERTKMDAMYPGKRLKVVGWDTTTDTRPIVVDAIANAIGQEAFECNYLPAVMEMKTFIINDRGKAAAKSGCFIAGTEILTESGCKPIEDVASNDRVFTHLGNLQNVGSAMRRPYAGKLFTLKVSGLPFPISATSEHPFWAKKRTSKWLQKRSQRKPVNSEWIAADSLSAGDWVCIPKRQDLKPHGLSENQLYTIGLWLAEGHFNSRGHGIEFTNTDRQMLERCAEALLKWFPNHTARPHGGRKEDRNKLITRASRAKITHRDRGEGKKRCYTLSFTSSDAFDFFDQFGHGAENKHLGSLASCSGLLPLIVGIIDGDGSQRKNQSRDVNYYTISWRLARQVWQALVDSSVWATCRKGARRQDRVHPCWTVNIKCNYIREIIGGKLELYHPKRLVSHVIEEPCAFFAPIRSVSSQEFCGDVFNFSVPGDESYVAGGVAVHNCHDDWVMGLGIGLANLEFAKPMAQPQPKARYVPKELDVERSIGSLPVRALS